MGKANLILIANFAVAKMVYGAKSIFSPEERKQNPSITTFYRL